MTDQDRGAYTPPTDAPLSFDARQPVRGSRPAPFTLIASGFILILLVAAIVLFYRTGVRQAGQGYVDAGRITGVDIAGKTKRVEPVQRNGSTLYRTTVMGFASRTQAAAFCAELKSAGKNCFVK
jgi:hypothetical protein